MSGEMKSRDGAKRSLVFVRSCSIQFPLMGPYTYHMSRTLLVAPPLG